MKTKTILAILNFLFIFTLISSLSLKSKSKNQLKSKDDCDDEQTIPILPTTPTLTFSNPNFTWFRTGFADGTNDDDTRTNYSNLSSSEFIHKVIDSDQSNGFCTKENIDLANFNNQITCSGSSSNTQFATIFKLCVKDGDKLSIRTYNDFGMGGILIVDGRQVLRHSHDIWWSMDYNNISFKYDLVSDKTGFYTFQLYGTEICCGGAQKIQYSLNGNEYKDYIVSEVENYCNSLGVKVSNDLSPVLHPTN